jgi:hypothetical protein
LFFDVFKVWDIVPSCEFFGLGSAVVASCWNPKTTEYSPLGTIDVTCAWDATFWCVLEIGIGLVLSTCFLFGEWFVAKGLGDELLFRCKSHDVISVMNWMNRMLRQ